MNLKTYLKDINEFLLKEETVENNVPVADDKSVVADSAVSGGGQEEPGTNGEVSPDEASQQPNAIEDLLQRFQAFLKKIDGKVTLEELQAASKNEQNPSPEADAQQPQQPATPQQAVQA